MRHTARPQSGAALPPPPGAGVRFIPSGCSQAALPSSSHSAAGFARVPRFAPAASGDRYAFAQRFAPRESTRFSFPRGVRRCGAPPSSGRRYAPPPSCAFSLPSARVSLPPFLPRVLSPFRECSCGVFPHAACSALRAVFSAARSAPFRAPPRCLPRFARRGCLCPRAVPASGQGHACTRLIHVKMVRRNVKSEMLKTHRRRSPVSPPSLVRFNSLYYLCGVFRLFNFFPPAGGVPSTIPHHSICLKVTCS